MRKIIIKVLIVLLLLACACTIFYLAPNYKANYEVGKVNLIINNNNITYSLEHDVIIQDKIIYVSKEDMSVFFDYYINYNEQYNLVITTTETVVASIEVGANVININGEDFEIAASVIEVNDVLYVPISEMEQVYNIEVDYKENTSVVTVDSLDREQKKATVTKNTTAKKLTKFLSRALDRLKTGDSVIYISETEDGFVKVRTGNGRIGYIEKENLQNIEIVRVGADAHSRPMEEKINLVWDYYYAAPEDRSGQTIPGLNVISPSFFELEQMNASIIDKADWNYIRWAKNKGYKIWPMFSNASMIETTSYILNDYKLRNKLIEDILELALYYDLDGINLDFEYMYEEDVNLYSRFVIELAPRLRAHGKVLSVDVTAPDGSSRWSLCYDRDVLAEAADYLVFMGYDQVGSDSPKASTIAGYDWVKSSLDKFIDEKREDVPAEKIILGCPFYTREWEEEDGILVGSYTVDMKKIDIVVPEETERIWDDRVKQYYAEYVIDGTTYKMWIEDERSLREKVKLVKEYNLAGAAFWELDRESDGIWEMVKQELK